MELLKFQNSFIKEDDKKSAVILCSQNKILRIVTFGEIAGFADQVRKFMLKNVQVNHICIGLLMEKNVFIPSIILSFQDLNYSFVFLTRQTLIKTTEDLNIKWILSYECDPLIDTFIVEDILQFSIKDELKLWRNTNNLENRKPLCFQDIFCVVQTSGSTGENKIVRIPHACIEKNVLSLNKHFGLSNTSTIYWGTPLTFDPTLVEFLLGLFYRATLLIVPKWISLNPTFLCDALFKIGCASFLQIVPSIFLRWNSKQISKILQDSCLRTLAFGGEPFPKEILDYKRRTDLKVFNLYGVTELSCWATISEVTSNATGENQILLGEALDDTFIELRNNCESTLDDIGEIFIGSNTRYCLLNESEENVNFPFVVKTGDLGKLTEHGLVYKGRKTRIIKRFGHKVNLNKIEENIFRELNLLSRLVYSSNHIKLLAFILIKEHFNKNTKIRLLDKLRVKLLKIISETEFPDFIDVVTKFPLNEHGKISDGTLEKYYDNSLNDLITDGQNPKDVFLNVLHHYLETDFSSHIEILEKYTFFELGGNSILAMQFLSEFKEHIGKDIPGELVTLILNENIQACIAYVQDKVTVKRKLLEDIVSKVSKKNCVLENKVLNCVIWTQDLKGCVDAPPLVFEKSNETYIAAGSFAHIFAVLNKNGEECLKLSLPQELEAKPCTSKCCNFIYVGCSNGLMYCINLPLKKIQWEYHTLQKINSTPCLCKESNAIIFGSYDNFVYCLGIENGTLLWKTELLGSIRADPIYCEKLKVAYVGTTKGMCYGINEENGTVVWTYKLDGPVFGSPCLVKNSVIWPCVTGLLYGISSTGDFQWIINIQGNIFSSLTAFENRIYFGCHDSRLYELSIADNKPRISRNFRLESEISSTPFVYKCGNKVLIICTCNVGFLYVIDLNSGEHLFTYRLPDQSFSSPYAFNNMVYVGCRDNNLYCIDITQAVIN